MLSKLLFLLLIIFTACKDTREIPTVNKGILDLRSHDVSKLSGNSFFDLNGEWEFYWKEFCGPVDKTANSPNQCESKEPAYLKVPDTWENFELNNNKISRQGYATYRMKILLPPESNPPDEYKLIDNDSHGLMLLKQNTSYRLFINGKLIKEVGKPAQLEEDEIPAQTTGIVSIPKSNEYEIIIQISNFKQATGGLWNKITFGKYKELLNEREKNIALDLFQSGAMILMGAYHLGLFFLRKKDKSIFYFGVFCLLIGVRPIITEEAFIFTLYPNFPWELSIKFDYLTISIGTPIFIHYLYSLFKEEMNKVLKIILLIASYSFSLIILFTPPIFFTYLLIYIQSILILSIIATISVMILSVIKSRTGALSFLFGSTAFSITIINDILHTNNLIYTGFYTPVGFLIFIFSQTYFLSKRFSNAINQTEQLAEELKLKSTSLLETSTELESLNKSLESKVEKRTKELKEALSTIRYDLKTAKKIQKNILRNPLGKIGNIRIQTSYEPMNDVGGDFYDYLKLQNGKIRILIADATGHGVQAALMTMTIFSEYQNIRDYEASPKDILSLLNAHYYLRYNFLSSYFTCILLDIDPTENKIYYASAGHNDQVVLGKEKFLKLSSTGKLMGVTEDVEYKEEIVEFLPEDKLILFTDGMFEELNEKDEEYGEERFLKFLSGQNNNTSESIIENAKNEIKNFLSESFQRDDMTIIVVDRVKE